MRGLGLATLLDPLQHLEHVGSHDGLDRLEPSHGNTCCSSRRVMLLVYSELRTSLRLAIHSRDTASKVCAIDRFSALRTTDGSIPSATRRRMSSRRSRALQADHGVNAERKLPLDAVHREPHAPPARTVRLHQ
jgi:hypothetical protein